MTPSLVRALGSLLLSAATISASAQPSPPRIYQLPIGDLDRRGRDVAVVLDTIIDTASGDTLTPDRLAARLKDVRLLLLGETHTSAEAHRVQGRVVRALHEAGRPVVIGLEMFPYTEQAALDRWSAGAIGEDDFIRESRWYEHWGYHWRYYRDIFVYARDQRLPMVAVNTPREVVTAVRRKGLAHLTPEEATHLPPSIDVDSPDHLTFFKASFEDGDELHGGAPDDAWAGMLAAQATWDATMGFNAVRALERTVQRDAIMVVLVGAGHVAYGVGIERQARHWFDGRIASIVPVPVRDPRGQPVASVRASYANFVWGVAAETDPPFPALGLSTRAAGGGGGLREVILVEKDSVGARSGFERGDVLVAMDGVALPDRETFNRLMAGVSWGDAVTFLVRRGAEERMLTAHFRRRHQGAP